MGTDGSAVGVIGLGIMGGAIAASLADRGFRVVGHHVDQARVAASERVGVNGARSPAEIAASCSVVITSLPSAAALVDPVARRRRGW